VGDRMAKLERVIGAALDRRLSVLPLASAIIVETVNGREVTGRADHIGHALAAALVAVAGGAS
jgi:hypothetical protein